MGMKNKITRVYTPSPRGGFGVGVSILLFSILLFVVSCSDEEQEYDPYANWASRNAQWFQSAMDSARKDIGEAKSQYGDEWENHAQWRVYKSLHQSQDYDSHRPTDSIVVRIVQRGTGSISPTWTDTVRISQRGWLMPTKYRMYNKQGQLVDSLRQEIFSQTYYGSFDPATAAPVLSAVDLFTEGFATALQYMVEGDDWLVYIPYPLAYGKSGRDVIPGYSTLQFRIHMAGVYPEGTPVPSWKAPARR